MSDVAVKVGILGTGNMANAFAEGLAYAEDLDLVAVASRSPVAAEKFAELHSVKKRYSAYADLANDPDIDLVYVATPHSRHKGDSLMCLQAGKGVLCEKPFAINAEEAKAVIDLAREQNLFLMEAMWSRFLPSFVRLRQLLADDAIGPVQLILAGGAFQPDRGADTYLWKPELGGGVLLDAGIYPVSVASMILGAPAQIMACGTIGEYEVDEQDAVLLQHESGATAMVYVSLNASASPDITILGTRGRIYVHAPMFAPGKIDLQVYGEGLQQFDLPFVGNGYQYQAIAAAMSIRNGSTESDVMPLNETLTIMHTLDRIRDQVGMRYPMEK